MTEQDARPPVDERFASLADEFDDEPMGFNNEVVTGPVSDWTTDFDHTDDNWAADPYPIIDDLRERCPVAHTDRYGGGWLPVRYDDVAEIAYDSRRTSRA